MKWLFFLAALFPIPVCAQGFNTPPPSNATEPAFSRPGGEGALAPGEITKLAAVRHQVLSQHPDWVQARISYYEKLIADQDAYISDPSIAQDLRQLQTMIETAMEQVDPTVTPLLARLHDAGRASRWGVSPRTVAPEQTAPVSTPAPAPTTGNPPDQVNIPPTGG
jgi:hypothetical protein